MFVLSRRIGAVEGSGVLVESISRALVKAIVTACLALALIAGMAIDLPKVLSLSAGPGVASVARPTAVSQLPAGLAGAIHRALGPGTINLGQAATAGITTSAAGWAATVPSEGLTASISKGGTVHLEVGSASLRGFAPTGLVTGASTETLQGTTSTLATGRLVQHMGSISTSYRVTSTGLEQTFSISRLASPGTVRLGLGSASGWKSAADSLSYAEKGWTLTYGGLRTTTATGATVPSHFALVNGDAQVVLEVPQDAAFPLHVDPTWSTTGIPTATLAPALGPPDHFGFEVSLSADGTTALVGAPNANSNAGAAFIFNVPTEGSWGNLSTPTATLTVSGIPSQQLGQAVSLSSDGSTALVGAPAANGGAGAAYVFHAPSEGAWSTTSVPTATLSDSTLTSNAFLGRALAISSDGTTAFIGARGANGNKGQVDVYQASSEASWANATAPVATLSNSGSAAGDVLGGAVAASRDGTTVIAGANEVSGGKGAAYVFHASAEDAWGTTATPTATLTNSASATGDIFGTSVAMSSDGTTALVGAPGATTAAAYLYQVANENSWTATATPSSTLSDPSDPSGSAFGFSVGFSHDGTTAIVGADGNTSATPDADIFQASSETTWPVTATPIARLTQSVLAPNNQFGESVVLSADGSLALVGAPAVFGFTGGAFVYHFSNETSWATTSSANATLTDGNNSVGSDFGFALNLSADGTTAIVGAPELNGSAGGAFIFHVNNENQWVSTTVPTATLSAGGGVGDQFGFSIALTPDGATAVIGARTAQSGQGAVYVFQAGSEASWTSTSSPSAILLHTGGSDSLGYSVAISSDGTTIVAGAPNENSNVGVAYVYRETSPGQWGNAGYPTATLTAPGSVFLGFAVALSTDGTTALITAAGTNSSTGSAYIFHVANEASWASSSSPSATLTKAGNAAGSEFGFDGSLSGDGTTALVGAFGVNSQTGAAYIYQVANEGAWVTTSTPGATLTNGVAGSAFGIGVELSRDGTTAVIAAQQANSNTGLADVFQVPNETSWATSNAPGAVLTVTGEHTGSFFGYPPSLSADGTTLLIGADGVDSNTGAAYIFHSAPLTPTITNEPGLGLVGGGFTANVTTNGDGPVSVTTASPAVCTVSGLFVSFVGVGTCSLTAHVGAGTNYPAADGTAQTFPVRRAPSTPTITNLPASGIFGGGFTATVSTTGDGQTSVTSNTPSVCTANGLVVHYVNIGTCSLTAQVAAGTNYVAGSGFPQTFQISQASHGYWLVGSDGGIFTFGSANFWGSTGNLRLNRPVVAITPTADHLGYWLVATDGGLFAFGDAQYYGSIPGLGIAPAGTIGAHALNAPIVGMVPSVDGKGYFMVASDGGVFAFGDAQFEGSCPQLPIGECASGVVGVAPDATGHGYWVATRTGNVYAFGDAVTFGGPGQPNSFVTSIVRTSDGGGYWVLDNLGHVYAFGDAVYMGGLPAGAAGGPDPASAIFATADGNGYWIATAVGQVYTFGDAPFAGDMSHIRLNGAIIAGTGF